MEKALEILTKTILIFLLLFFNAAGKDKNRLCSLIDSLTHSKSFAMYDFLEYESLFTKRSRNCLDLWEKLCMKFQN